MLCPSQCHWPGSPQWLPVGAGWGSDGGGGNTVADTANPVHYCEGAAQLELGSGFFRPESRPSRDLGVLLARVIAAQRPLTLLDVMAGCGIRALRYGLEGGAAQVWANDADADRLPLLQTNLQPLARQGCQLETTARTAQHLLADCLMQQRRFELLDLDAFGCPTSLVPLALEALAFDGVLYLASTDGRSPTGHDRPAAIRSLGAAARAHPASWELALRLQIAVVARAAWALGRGLRPLFSFSEGRTFRTAIQLRRRPEPREEEQMGLLAYCHRCADQQHQSLLHLRQWSSCACSEASPLSVSGPLWLGPLQHAPTLEAMEQAAAQLPTSSISPASLRLAAKLRSDPGLPPSCWPLAELGRRLGGGPPALDRLLELLRSEGFVADRSAVMAGQFRCNAPFQRVLELASALNR